MVLKEREQACKKDHETTCTFRNPRILLHVTCVRMMHYCNGSVLSPGASTLWRYDHGCMTTAIHNFRHTLLQLNKEII